MRRAGPALAPPQGRAGPVLAHQQGRAGPVLAHQPHLPMGRQARPGRRTTQIKGQEVSS